MNEGSSKINVNALCFWMILKLQNKSIYQHLSDLPVHFEIYWLVLNFWFVFVECSAGCLEQCAFSVTVLLACISLTIVIFINFFIFQHTCYRKKEKKSGLVSAISWQWEKHNILNIVHVAYYVEIFAMNSLHSTLKEQRI